MFLSKLKISQKMFLGFGIVTLLMLAVIVNSYINFTKQSISVESNISTFQVIAKSDAILISLINMETGARGYVITGDKSFLEPFEEGKLDYEKHYYEMKELISGNKGQQERLINIQNHYTIWLDFQTNEIIGGRQKVLAGQYNMEELIKVAQSGKGKAEMDKIRSVLEDINEEEQRVLQVKNNERKKMESETKIIMSMGGLLATILAVIIASLVIKMVINPVKTVTNTFKEISEGDANLEVRLNVNSNDELGDMARYFNRFMVKLKELILENKNQSWVKTGQAELNEKIRGEQDMAALGVNIINYITKYIEAQIGAIYIKTDDTTFRLFGSYAYNTRKNLSNEIRVGEGIVGQSALEKQSIIMTNVPEDYIKIVSGVGEAVPRNILVTPCVYDKEVECILELGSFNEFTDVQLKFVEQVSESIAITIKSTKAQHKMKELLDKTLVQSEELQAQQEELRQNNEELGEQARSLKDSEMNLQSQQEELRVINEELEERTRNLEMQKNDIATKNESLRNAQFEIEEKAKALEVTSKYKSEFLANMSHELRTPLNSILVLSQMLENKKDNSPLTEKQLEYAKTIHSSGEDLLKLINDILDLAKVEAGKLDINFEKINLEELTGNLRRSFDTIAEQKGLDFKIEIEKGLPEEIISDSQRLQQIINNLLSNAFKFTHSGEVKMTICRPERSNILSVQDNINDFISIAITDTGIGIPLTKQKLIFEAFKQSDGTTSRKYGGTGLGLSISKELAALLGGTIHLRSEENKGSTFTLVLPDKKDILWEESKVNEEKEQGNSETFKDHEKNINLSINNEISRMNTVDYKEIISGEEKLLLIIEDDEKFLNVLSELASGKGYRPLSAKGGEDGIKLAIKYKPDAILLDIGLPDINGWKVIDRLKENKITKDIPVHVISGKEAEVSNKNMESLVGYLEKPVNLGELYGVFKKFEDTISKPFKKLLIVDEDKEEVKAIAHNLSKLGVEITTSETGLEAYNILKTEQFDCMIMDLKLQDMSGVELLNKLREENMINFPILIHTENKITQEYEAELKKYTESIIIKGNKSIERLVDEASLFLHDVDSRIEKEKIKAIKSNHEKEHSLNNKKILIVDDDMRNVFALSAALEERGITVVVGRNGREGIKKLHQNLDVDLILMDIMMPEMDGYTAMREIRKEEKSRRVPIIAITAKAMKDDRQKCIEAGADDYLTKPIEMDKLISLLRVWLYK